MATTTLQTIARLSVGAVVAGLLTGFAAPASAGPVPTAGPPYGPDTCKQGFVWREAIPSDHVCVYPATRSQTWYDNSQAAARRDPTGPYGSNSCKQGYVWREAFRGDAVCVTGATRAQAAYDNSVAHLRRVG